MTVLFYFFIFVVLFVFKRLAFNDVWDNTTCHMDCGGWGCLFSVESALQRERVKEMLCVPVKIASTKTLMRLVISGLPAVSLLPSLPLCKRQHREL